MKLIIQNDRIAATALPEHQPTGNEQAVIDAPESFDSARMGDYRWQDGALVLPPRQHPPISPAQLAIALMLAGHITEDDAVAFGGSGVVPAALSVGINVALAASGLPAIAQSMARVKLASAIEYSRDDPATPIIGAVLGLDAAGLDALWDTAAAF